MRVCVCVPDINAFIAQSTLKERERERERENGKVRQQLKGMETKNHRFDDLIIEETSEEGWLTAGRRQGGEKRGTPAWLAATVGCNRGVPD